MDILIGHNSALEYWRTVGVAFLGDRRLRRMATTRARRACSSLEKPRLSGGNRRPAGCILPLEVLVSSRAARTEASSVVSSFWSTSLPECSFVGAGQGFLVSTPEFMFLQMANRLSLARLIMLAFELCGTYTLAAEGPALRRKASLTTVAKLQAFVEAAPGSRGSKKALRALRYVRDGSASPMESALVMLLCLPYALGGYALSWPKLNYKVDVPRSRRKLADRKYCECDLCWPVTSLVVEYDSHRHHSEAERQERDARRRSTLIALGFTIVTVSRAQVMDSGSFNRLAGQLAKLTGKRLRYQDPAFTHKHFELRAEVFDAIGIAKEE